MSKQLTLTAKYLPAFDVRDHHEVFVPVGPEIAYDALCRLDFSRSRLIRAIFAVRTLPSRLRGGEWGSPSGPLLDQTLELGWVILEEEPGRELVAGAVTQPWKAVVTFRGLPPEEFAAFSEPGFVKIVWGIGASASGSGSVAATETRALATDPVSRAKFRRYWLVVGIGVRLIRRLALGVLRRDLVRGQRGRLNPAE